MADPVLDDPGELLRFWLWHRFHHTVQSFSQSKLAKALDVSPARVGAWLDRHAVPTNYWSGIARYFERESYRALEDEARALWAVVANRRGYAPLYTLQKKRLRGAIASGTVAPKLASAATP